MKLLVNLLDRLVHMMSLLAAVAAATMAIFVALSAVMRYVAGSPFRFSEDLVGLLFVAAAFLAIPLVQMRRRGISVDILTSIMPLKLRRFADAGATLVLVVFGVAFIVVSYEYTAFSKLIHARSEIGHMVLWPWMALMPFCMSVLTLVGLAQLYDAVRVLLGHESIMPVQASESLRIE